MRAIGCLAAVIILIFASGFLFGFSFVKSIFKTLFGTGSATQKASSNQRNTKQTTKQPNASSVKKIITRDEGEYVDFEEIKDS